jgi:nucleotide-binding universal stress UspA family protein
MAQKTLKKTVEYFKLLKPDIVLLCVTQDVLDVRLAGDRFTEEYEKEHGDIIHNAAEWVAANGLEVHVMLASGGSRQKIVEAIEKQLPDIVVVARKERSTFESVFFKSISDYLFYPLQCFNFFVFFHLKCCIRNLSCKTSLSGRKS